MEYVLAGKKIILGVCGSIAAYKAADWLRNLGRIGAETSVVMTGAAAKFVTPLTFAVLSGKEVHTSMFHEVGAETIPHINLARQHDLILIAPATAQTMARLANGLADDLLSTVVLAADCPVVICPAMNPVMYMNPATQANIARLREFGYQVVEPESGDMACGDQGPGRLPEWPVVANALAGAFWGRDFSGATVLVTAGPTHEALDPVRFLSNRSSGKMGYAIARGAALRGARVILVSGPTSLPSPPGVETVRVSSAAQMLEAVMARYDEASVIVKAAAVSDYRPVSRSAEKIKKGRQQIELPLTFNADILKELGARREGNATPPVLVGFAAESTGHLEEGRRKLREKGPDLMVVNDIAGDTTGFGVDTNQVTLLDKDGDCQELPLLSKDETAMAILDKITKFL